MPHAMIKVITKGSSTILSSSKGYSGDEQHPPRCHARGSQWQRITLGRYELAENLRAKDKVGDLPQRVGNDYPLLPVQA